MKLIGDRVKWVCHLGNQYEGVVVRIMDNVVAVEDDRGRIRYVRKENIIGEKK
jgi:hypothetical protein